MAITAQTTTGSGTWTVPEGVTHLPEVLIVAGDAFARYLSCR